MSEKIIVSSELKPMNGYIGTFCNALVEWDLLTGTNKEKSYLSVINHILYSIGKEYREFEFFDRFLGPLYEGDNSQDWLNLSVDIKLTKKDIITTFNIIDMIIIEHYKTSGITISLLIIGLAEELKLFFMERIYNRPQKILKLKNKIERAKKIENFPQPMLLEFQKNLNNLESEDNMKKCRNQLEIWEQTISKRFNVDLYHKMEFDYKNS